MKMIDFMQISVTAFSSCLAIFAILVNHLNFARGLLTILGAGATYNYAGLETPWWSYKDSIKSIVIEAGITAIGDGTFQSLTNLEQVSMPSTVTSIGGHAFVGCSSLASITIPSTVTFIGEGAFHGCDKLSFFTVLSGNQIYCSIDGVLFSKDGKTLLQYPYAKSNSYTIPNGVTSIGRYAFVHAPSLTSVAIPSSVTSINYCAFCDCYALTKVTYYGTIDPGDSSSYIFYDCYNLYCLLVPPSYTSNTFCGHSVVKGNACPAPTPTASRSPSRSPMATRSRSPMATPSKSPTASPSNKFTAPVDYFQRNLKMNTIAVYQVLYHTFML